MSSMRTETEQAAQRSAGAGSDVHPRARAFFEEVADARRARREVMLALEPGSGQFRALTGNAALPDSSREPRVSRIPGEEDSGTVGSVTPGLFTDSRGAPNFDESLRREPAKFALNAMHAYTGSWDDDDNVIVEATKFGTGYQPFEDASRLGAAVIRQLGSRDLLWGMQAPFLNPESLEEFSTAQEIPLSADLAEVTKYAMDQEGNLRWNFDLLADQSLDLSYHFSSGKIVYTFFYLGGGDVNGTTDTPPEPGIDGDYITDAVEYVSGSSEIDWNGSSGVFGPVGWSEDHLGESVTGDDSTAFPLNASSDHIDWFFESIDPACPYKRVYLGEIARVMAQRLVDVSLYSPYALPALADQIEAIEIFNEVDDRDWWEFAGGHSPDLASMGEKWGRAFLHAAWSFRDVLGPDVPIWLPGISSYHDVAGKTWEDKLDFVEGFVQGMVNEARENASLLGAENAEEVYEAFPSLAQGIDLHWYHRDARSDAGLRHIGFLVEEIGELRSELTTAFRDAVGDYVSDTDFGADFPISVCETGWGLDDIAPTNSDYDPTTDAETFQACEVWRRLGGALAGGAKVVGWHSWMSSGGSNFNKMGLRKDDLAMRAPASDSEPRSSWYAYLILARLLGGRVTSGSMVVPAIGGRGDLPDPGHNTPDGIAQAPVVFEYRLLDGSGVLSNQYAYLVLLDPSQLRANTPYQLTAIPSVPYGPPGGIAVYSPFGYLAQSRVDGSDDELPFYDVVTPVGYTIPMMGFTVTPTLLEPRLYLSPRRLVWELQAPSTSSSVASRLYSTPAWMDDAGSDVPMGGERLSGGGPG